MDLKEILDGQPSADWVTIKDKGQIYVLDRNRIKLERIDFTSTNHTIYKGRGKYVE